MTPSDSDLVLEVERCLNRTGRVHPLPPGSGSLSEVLQNWIAAGPDNRRTAEELVDHAASEPDPDDVGWPAWDLKSYRLTEPIDRVLKGGSGGVLEDRGFVRARRATRVRRWLLQKWDSA